VNYCYINYPRATEVVLRFPGSPNRNIHGCYVLDPRREWILYDGLHFRERNIIPWVVYNYGEERCMVGSVVGVTSPCYSWYLG